MSRHTLVIALACAAALTVLGLTVWLGGGLETAGDTASTTQQSEDDDASQNGDTSQQPRDTFNPRDAVDQGELAGSQVVEAAGGGYTIVEGEDRVIEMRWRAIDPRPQNVSDVTRPRAEVYFGAEPAQEALVITADHGTLIAPENKPEEGDLVGNVILTLYETEENRRVDLTGTRDMQLRAYMHAASFNLDLGHIESGTPVHLLTRRAEFRGEGLSLTYNERRKRIQRLEVMRGESLRFHPSDEASDPPQEESANVEDGSDDDAPRDDKPAGTQPTEDAPDEAASNDVDVAATQPEAEEPAAAQRASGDAADATPAAPATEIAAGSETDTKNAPVTQPASDDAHDAPQEDAPQEDAPQFYRATFADDVTVDVGPDRMTMQANELAAVFALAEMERSTAAEGAADANNQRDEGEEEAEASAQTPAPPAASESDTATAQQEAREKTAQANTTDNNTNQNTTTANTTTEPAATQGATQAATQDAANDRPDVLFTPRPDDVTVRWTGPLLVLPIARMPADFAGPDDMSLTLTGAPGSPAIARTGEDEAMTGRTIDYLASTGRLRAHPGDDEPVHLTGPELGTLVSRGIVVNQATATGVVTGPGWLRTVPEQADDNDDNDQSTGELEIRWQDTLDLTFYRAQDDTARHGATQSADDADDPLAAGHELAGLRAAQFHRDIDAHHPRFDLTAKDTLRVGFATPDTPGDRLRRLDASGDAALTARPEDPDEPPMDMNAQSLLIELTSDSDHNAVPDRLIAAGDVYIAEPTQQLASQHLLVEFTKPQAKAPATQSARTQPASTQPATTQPAAQPGEDGTVAQSGFGDRGDIERMVATGGVRLRTSEPSTEATAHRLVADRAADRVELFAENEGDTLAQIVREGGTLAGRHIIARGSEQTVHVNGPGWFDAPLKDDEVADQLRVNWQREMHFDDEAGDARFAGNVKSVMVDAQTEARLESEHLQLELAPVTDADHDNEEAQRNGGGDGNGDGDAFAQSDRRVRAARARGDVRFDAVQRTAGDEKPQTSIRIEGDLMTFDGETEQIHVIGPGWMLIKDHRPAQQANADNNGNDNANEGPVPGVQFSGRGDTLFRWNERMILDAKNNDVRMIGAVEMLHRPTGGEQVVQLNSDRLFADLADTGGLAVWASDEAPDTEVNLIRATGNVHVRDPKGTIQSDFLQYTRDDQLVRLRAEGDRMVRINRRGQPSDFRFEEGIWNLETDTFDAREIGPGVVPITE